MFAAPLATLYCMLGIFETYAVKQPEPSVETPACPLCCDRIESDRIATVAGRLERSSRQRTDHSALLFEPA
jgi:hypothetical protein